MRSILPSILLLFYACASVSEKAATEQFPELIAKATALREQGSTDRTQYLALVDALTQIKNVAPDYKTRGENMRLASEFIAQYPSIVCEIAVQEPNEKYYVSTGFLTPLALTTACPIKAPFHFEADSTTITLAPAGFTYAENKMTAKVKVNSANLDKSKNRLRFSAGYYASELLKQLRADFDSVENNIIAINPVEYVIQAEPMASAADNATVAKSLESTVPARAESKNTKSQASIAIDEQSILAKVSFQKGSIQLSQEMRRQLLGLGLKPGQKLRIAGFGDGSGKKNEHLANLRARVVASFLNEAIGEFDTNLIWQAPKHARFDEGAIVEEVH